MLHTSVLLTIAVAAQAVFGSPIQSRTAYAVKETHYLPRGWVKTGRASAERMLNIKIGVKQGQFNELKRHVNEVSDPSHSRYGQHLTPEEVNDLIKPTDDTLDLVHEWLNANGIVYASYSPAKDWINVHINVLTAERLLDTEYYVFKYDDGTEFVRTLEWSLPIHLHEHVDAIQPTTSFLRNMKRSDMPLSHDVKRQDAPVAIPFPFPGLNEPKSPELKKVCTVYGTTPDCFQTLYKIKGYKQKAAGKNQIGFNNFLGEFPVRPDIKQFLTKNKPDALAGAANLKSVELDNGPPVQDTPLTLEQADTTISVEADLDAQTIIAMSYPMPVTSYSTGGEPPQIPDEAAGDPPGNEPYLPWLNYVLAQKDLPQVISTSYGDDEQTVPIEYAKRVCNSFAQLGARGISILFSSGDGGAGGIARDDAAACISNDGKKTFKFLPEFPAGCPWVTAVGATQGFEPETSAYRPQNSNGPDGKIRSYWASGSGFSEYFKRPSYQDKVVPAYVKGMKGEHKGLFNPEGRAVPDLSAQGLYFEIVWNSTFRTVSGTSASAPLMASIIALTNDALISSGKPPLGFLNPWLYSKGYKAFTDITSGLNGGCNTTGFPVTKGWDAVTGFGTPIFPELVKLANDGW